MECMSIGAADVSGVSAVLPWCWRLRLSVLSAAGCRLPSRLFRRPGPSAGRGERGSAQWAAARRVGMLRGASHLRPTRSSGPRAPPLSGTPTRLIRRVCTAVGRQRATVESPYLLSHLLRRLRRLASRPDGNAHAGLHGWARERGGFRGCGCARGWGRDGPRWAGYGRWASHYDGGPVSVCLLGDRAVRRVGAGLVRRPWMPATTARSTLAVSGMGRGWRR